MALRLRRPKKHKHHKPLPWFIIASALFALAIVCVGAYFTYALVDHTTGDSSRCIMPDPLPSA